MIDRIAALINLLEHTKSSDQRYSLLSKRLTAIKIMIVNTTDGIRQENFEKMNQTIQLIYVFFEKSLSNLFSFRSLTEEIFRFDIMLMQHQVDLMDNYNTKEELITLSIRDREKLRDDIHENQLSQAIGSTTVDKNISTINTIMVPSKNFKELQKRYHSIMDSYTRKCLELYGSLSIKGLGSKLDQYVSVVYEATLQSSSPIRKAFNFPLESVYMNLHADNSSEFERTQAKHIILSSTNGFANDTYDRTLWSNLVIKPLMPSLIERDRFVYGKNTEATSILDILRNERSIVILGDPGSGKTTFVQWLTSKFARTHINQKNAVRDTPETDIDVQIQEDDKHENTNQVGNVREKQSIVSSDLKISFGMVRLDQVTRMAPVNLEQLDQLFGKMVPSESTDERDDMEELVETIDPTRIPILIRIADFAEALETLPSLSLFEYIGQHKWYGKSVLSNDHMDELSLALQNYISQGSALVILDGLDELSSGRKKIVNLIENFVAKYVYKLTDVRLSGNTSQIETDKSQRMSGNQIIVTSRIVGYHSCPLNGQFAHFTIKPMSIDQINKFIDRWFKAIHEEIVKHIADQSIIIEENKIPWKQQATLLKDKLKDSENKGLRELASNPCLLTFLCTLSLQNVQLPKQRILLYKQTVDLMLQIWTDRTSTSVNPNKIYLILYDVAAYIHENHPTGLIEETKLKEICMRTLQTFSDSSKEENEVFTDMFIKIISEDTGILAARGTHAYGFLHLTFQEYFTCLNFFKQVAEETDASRERKMAKIFHQHITDPRYRVPLILALGWISVRWQHENKSNQFYSELISMDNHDYSVAVPLGAHLLVVAIDDFVNLPSDDILLRVFDQLLTASHQYQWEHYSKELYKQTTLALAKMPMKFINEWATKSLSSMPPISVVENLVQLLYEANMQMNKNKPSEKEPVYYPWLDQKIITILINHYVCIETQTTFSLTLFLRIIAKRRPDLLPSNELRTYFVKNSIKAKQIHPLVLSIIIAIYGGLYVIPPTKPDHYSLILSPPCFIRESTMSSLLIEYFEDKTTEDQNLKLKILIQNVERKIEDISMGDQSLDSIDCFIALLCLKGMEDVLHYQLYCRYEAFDLALNRLKFALHYMKIYYEIYKSDNTYAKNLIKKLIDLDNEFLITFLINLGKLTEYIKTSLQLVNVLPKALSRITKSCVNNIAPSHWNNSVYWQNLFQSAVSSEIEIDLPILFLSQFWVLKGDKDTDSLGRISNLRNFTPQIPFLTSGRNPFYVLIFAPKHLQNIFIRLLKQDYMVLAIADVYIKNKYKLPFAHILIECLFYLNNSFCNTTIRTYALCALLPMLRTFKLENLAFSLLWSYPDKAGYFQTAYDENRLSCMTGHDDDQNGVLLNTHIAEEELRTIIENIIQQECERLQTTDDDTNSELDRNVQLYTASISLSYVSSWSRNTNKLNLFNKALEATRTITDPLMKLDALCIITSHSNVPDSISSSIRSDILKLINEIPSDIPVLLYCTLLVTKFIPLFCLDTHLILNCFEQLYDRISTMQNNDKALADQTAIHQALAEVNPIYPSAHAHLIEFLRKNSNHETYPDILVSIEQYNSLVIGKYIRNQSHRFRKSVDHLHFTCSYLSELISNVQRIPLLFHDFNNDNELLQYTTSKQFFLSSTLSFQQIVLIDKVLDHFQSCPTKQKYKAALAEIEKGFENVRYIDNIGRKILEKWLEYDCHNDPVLYTFACYAALFLIRSNKWSSLIITVLCQNLTNDDDYIRRETELALTLSGHHVRYTSQIGINSLLTLLKQRAMYYSKSSYATFIINKTLWTIEIDDNEHLDLILELEKERIGIDLNERISNTAIRQQFQSLGIPSNIAFFDYVNSFSIHVIQHLIDKYIDPFILRKESNNINNDKVDELFSLRLLSYGCAAIFGVTRTSSTAKDVLMKKLGNILKNTSLSLEIQKAITFALAYRRDKNTRFFSFMLQIIKSNNTSNQLKSLMIYSYFRYATLSGHTIEEEDKQYFLQIALETLSPLCEATRHGITFLYASQNVNLLNAMNHDYILCYHLLTIGTCDLYMTDLSQRCVQGLANLINDYPDLLSLFILQLYNSIKHFTHEIELLTKENALYYNGDKDLVSVAALLVKHIPAAFCSYVEQCAFSQELKQSLYYVSLQHAVLRRKASLEVLSTFGDLTPQMCEMFVNALLEDTTLQRTCYECFTKIRFVSDRQNTVEKLKIYLTSKSMTVRYASAKLLVYLAQTKILPITSVQELINLAVQDPSSESRLWIIVEDDIFRPVYCNYGKLNTVLYNLLMQVSFDESNNEKLFKPSISQGFDLNKDYRTAELFSNVAACDFVYDGGLFRQPRDPRDDMFDFWRSTFTKILEFDTPSDTSCNEQNDDVNEFENGNDQNENVNDNANRVNSGTEEECTDLDESHENKVIERRDEPLSSNHNDEIMKISTTARQLNSSSLANNHNELCSIPTNLNHNIKNKSISREILSEDPNRADKNFIDNNSGEQGCNSDNSYELSSSFTTTVEKQQHIKHNLDSIRQKQFEYDRQQLKGFQLSNAGSGNLRIVNSYSVTSSTCTLL